jgi:hypothetical protein
MAMRDDFEQEARIALLKHFTSQMQGYKVNLLTIVVGFLAYVQLIGRLPPFYFVYLLPIGVGILAALGFWSVTRFLWYGKHVRDIIRKPLARSSENMLNRLDLQLHDGWGKREEYDPNSLFGKVIKIGGPGTRLFYYSLLVGIFVALVMSLLAPSFVFLGASCGP